MNPYRIHLRLSNAIQHNSRLRNELSNGQVSLVRHVSYRVRSALLAGQIRRLTARLRRS